MAKTSKMKGEKNAKKSDQILGHEPLTPPLLYSNVPNWFSIRIWDFANVPKFTFFKATPEQFYFPLLQQKNTFQHIWIVYTNI